METIGKPIVFNICMLGVIVGIPDLVKSDSIFKVFSERIPPGFIDLNRQAFDLGLKLGKRE